MGEARLGAGEMSGPDILIALVGPCASGKSTLGRRLRELGYTVREPAQEHSFVPELWRHMGDPDLLIFLDVGLAMIEDRGRTRWTQSGLDEQHRRLKHAWQHCDFYLSTDYLTEEQVFRRVLAFLSVDR